MPEINEVMNATEKDYYQILGISREAEPKAIKTAFRRLAMKYHPDRSKEPDAEARFKEIAEAYGVLSDPKKRAMYDKHGHAGISDMSYEDIFGGIDLGDIFGGHDFGFGSSIFDSLFGHGRPKGPVQGSNLEVRLNVPLAVIAQGGKQEVRYHRQKQCATCHGTKAKPGTSPQQCSECAGSGRKIIQRKSEGVTFQQITTCAQCQGSGVTVKSKCPDCKGMGVTLVEEKINVTIPKGLEEGMPLRVAGHGMPPPIDSGVPGDLFVIVRTEPDSRFERQGANLVSSRMIAITDAVLGCDLAISCLEGSEILHVPPGTQPGAIFEMKGKGLPDFNSHGVGSLYVRISIEIPKLLTPKEQTLWEALRRQHKAQKQVLTQDDQSDAS